MLILTNAQLVLSGAVVRGTVTLDSASIGDIQPGASLASSAQDLDGDYLIPGAVDLHTDNLERQVQPRSNARWPSRSALAAHDAQCAAAGITTVLDALCVGDLGYESDRVRTFHDGITDLDALAETGLLKAAHFLHLRCELPAPEMLSLLDPVAEHPRVRLISLMDHSPGIGQYANLDYYRSLRRKDGLDSAFIERRIAELQAQRERFRGPNRAALLARVHGLGVALASHDDRYGRGRRRECRRRHPDRRVSGQHGGRNGGAGARHAGDRGGAQPGPRRVTFRQRRRRGLGARARSGRLRVRLRAGEPD